LKEILAGIEEAIAAEREAQERYQALSEKAEDPRVKGMFEQMRLDEQEHEEVLLARYEALKKQLDAQKGP